MKLMNLGKLKNPRILPVIIALALTGARCPRAVAEITPGFMKGVRSGAIKIHRLPGVLVVNPPKGLALHIKPLPATVTSGVLV